MIVDDKIRDIIKGGEIYLAKNDLEGFYQSYLFLLPGEHKMYIEDYHTITNVLEQCGIDTFGYFANKGYFPSCYFYGGNAQVGPIRSHCVGNLTDVYPGQRAFIIPRGVRSINMAAFGHCIMPYIIDVRYVTDIEKAAFMEVTAHTVIFGDKTTYVDADAFMRSPISTMFFPKSLDSEEGEEYITELLSPAMKHLGDIEVKFY